MNHAEMAKQILAAYQPKIDEKMERDCAEGGWKTFYMLQVAGIHATLALTDALKQHGADEIAKKLLEEVDESEK